MKLVNHHMRDMAMDMKFESDVVQDQASAHEGGALRELDEPRQPRALGMLGAFGVDALALDQTSPSLPLWPSPDWQGEGEMPWSDRSVMLRDEDDDDDDEFFDDDDDDDFDDDDDYFDDEDEDDDEDDDDDDDDDEYFDEEEEEEEEL